MKDDKKEDKKYTSAKKTTKKEPAKTGVEGKIQKLKKQYDKILTDLFNEHAGSCIEEALSSSENAFGMDIVSIVGTATDLLRGKILAELGMDDECCDMEMGVATVTPSLGIGGVLEIGDKASEDDTDDEFEEGDED